jgi:hypothetical protein
MSHSRGDRQRRKSARQRQQQCSQTTGKEQSGAQQHAFSRVPAKKKKEKEAAG